MMMMMWSEPAVRSVKDGVNIDETPAGGRFSDAGSRGPAVSCILCMESIVGGADQLQQHLLMVSTAEMDAGPSFVTQPNPTQPNRAGVRKELLQTVKASMLRSHREETRELPRRKR